MVMRYITGGLYAVIALIFLSVNSYILGKFGYKWGQSEYEKLGFALVAGAVPWALAPHLHVMAAKQRQMTALGGRRRLAAAIRRQIRTITGLIPFLVVYVVFVGYNVLGGTGATAFSRAEVQGQREHVIDETARLKKQRKALEDQLAGIPPHRPPDAVQPILASTLLHPFWKATGQCAEGQVLNKNRRDYCAEVGKLKAEIANAERADKVNADIKAIDAKLNEERRAVSTVDPQVAFLASVSGYSQDSILVLLLLATPLVLEIGALYWGKQAMDLLGAHLELHPIPEVMPPTHQLPPPVKPLTTVRGEDALPRLLTSTPGFLVGDDPRQMTAVLHEFWARRTRRQDGVQVPETTLYEHYRSMCAERTVASYPIETFRRLSAERVPSTVMINGALWYCHILHTDEATA